MKHTRIARGMTAGLITALVLLASVATPPARAGDPPPTTPPAEETPDMKAAAFVKDLAPKQAQQADADAKASIVRIVEILKDAKVTPETKKTTVPLLNHYARSFAKPEISQAAIEACGELAPEDGAKASLDTLAKALKVKEPNRDVWGACFRTLKKLADPEKSTTNALVEYLKYKEDEVVAKSADAMAGYKNAPGKIRKEMLEELIKQTEGVFTGSTTSGNDAAKRKWNAISGPVVSALQALSGQPLTDPVHARKWFNDNKKNSKIW